MVAFNVGVPGQIERTYGLRFGQHFVARVAPAFGRFLRPDERRAWRRAGRRDLATTGNAICQISGCNRPDTSRQRSDVDHHRRHA
jgi:hypothetical protein